MGLQWYLFATYVFVLLCLLVLLCNYLFADLKRQKKLLDEKESKLLKLYSGLESTMDEFSDTVTAARTEWDQRHAQLQALAREVTGAAANARQAPPARAAAPAPEPAPRKRTPKPAPSPEEPLIPAEEEAGFQLLFEQASAVEEQPAAAPAESQPEARRQRGPTRHDNILSLYEEGKTRTQIAQELGITQNEVDLVIGIEKK